MLLVAVILPRLAMIVANDRLALFELPAQSMSPTLLAGDHIVVKKHVPRFRRGDVVVFRFPHDPAVSYVKRILAVGGDVIEQRYGDLLINGAPVPRRALDQRCPGTTAADGCHLWEESLDGRHWQIGSDGTEPNFPRVVVPVEPDRQARRVNPGRDAGRITPRPAYGALRP